MKTNNKLLLFIFTFFKIRKIKKEGIKDFERRAKDIKERLANDVTVPDEELQERCLQEVILARKKVTEEVEIKVKELIEFTKKKSNLV